MRIPYVLGYEALNPFGGWPYLPRILFEEIFADLDMTKKRSDCEKVFYSRIGGADLLDRQFPGREYSQRYFILPVPVELLLVVPVYMLLG